MSIALYVVKRAFEPGTWLGLALIVGAFLVLWLDQERIIEAATTAIVGGALSLVPDRLFNPSKLVSTLRGAPVAVPQKEEPKMSVVSDLTSYVEKAAIAAVTDFVSNAPIGAEEKAAVQAVMSARSSPSISNAIIAIEDVLKVVADLKAQVSAASDTQTSSAPIPTDPVPAQ